MKERIISPIRTGEVDNQEAVAYEGHMYLFHNSLENENEPSLDNYFGRERRESQVGILPWYYGELLAWALHRYIEENGWDVEQVQAYHGRKPLFSDVSTDIDKKESLLRDGQMLVTKNECHLVISVDTNIQGGNSILVEGLAKGKDIIEQFVAGLLLIAKERNFYRGKKMEFRGSIRLLDIKDRCWDSVILDNETKEEIRANSVGFIQQNDKWGKYGIPLKRGILLAGEPGTGKTAICKAVLAEAKNISCIVTSAYSEEAIGYITELYELAKDLSPAIVLIEDIDLIAQNRNEYGYRNGSALISLLAVLDGLEEQQDIVTIATTNGLATLDKALSERPSRFDRVIQIAKPSLQQRREFVKHIGERIPMDKTTQEIIAVKSDCLTPAQVQEIVYSLVISRRKEHQMAFSFNDADITKAVARLKGNAHAQSLGFVGMDKHFTDYDKIE